MDPENEIRELVLRGLEQRFGRLGSVLLLGDSWGYWQTDSLFDPTCTTHPVVRWPQLFGLVVVRDWQKRRTVVYYGDASRYLGVPRGDL